MEAGKLRHRITFQNQANSHDSYGQPLLTWSDVATVWAEIKPLSGKESVKADALIESTTHEINIRYRSGINASLRVKFGSRYFDIQSVLNHDERNVMLTLLCVEGLNDG